MTTPSTIAEAPCPYCRATVLLATAERVVDLPDITAELVTDPYRIANPVRYELTHLAPMHHRQQVTHRWSGEFMVRIVKGLHVTDAAPAAPPHTPPGRRRR